MRCRAQQPRAGPAQADTGFVGGAVGPARAAPFLTCLLSDVNISFFTKRLLLFAAIFLTGCGSSEPVVPGTVLTTTPTLPMGATASLALAECQQLGITYVNITPLTRPATGDRSQFTSDGPHYSGVQMRTWAERALPVVKKLLQ